MKYQGFSFSSKCDVEDFNGSNILRKKNIQKTYQEIVDHLDEINQELSDFMRRSKPVIFEGEDVSNSRVFIFPRIIDDDDRLEIVMEKKRGAHDSYFVDNDSAYGWPLDLLTMSDTFGKYAPSFFSDPTEPEACVKFGQLSESSLNDRKEDFCSKNNMTVDEWNNHANSFYDFEPAAYRVIFPIYSSKKDDFDTQTAVQDISKNISDINESVAYMLGADESSHLDILLSKSSDASNHVCAIIKTDIDFDELFGVYYNERNRELTNALRAAFEDNSDYYIKPEWSYISPISQSELAEYEKISLGANTKTNTLDTSSVDHSADEKTELNESLCNEGVSTEKQNEYSC